VASPMHAAPIAIDEPLGEAIDAVKHLAVRRSVRIVNSSDRDAYVTGSRAMLKRLFVALLDNAIKNSRENEQIRIAVERAGDSVTVCIRDFGCGINPVDLPHIFQRFYRADKSRTGEGYGLGLSIAENIARAHAAEISVTSTPGEGATFVVQMPAVAVAPVVRDAAEISA
jgi:signal transduction histidine kinase